MSKLNSAALKLWTDDFSQPPDGTSTDSNAGSVSARSEMDLAEQKARNQRVIQLLNSWLADESGYDEATWPKVKKALEENRLSRRRRFCD